MHLRRERDARFFRHDAYGVTCSHTRAQQQNCLLNLLRRETRIDFQNCPVFLHLTGLAQVSQ